MSSDWQVLGLPVCADGPRCCSATDKDWRQGSSEATNRGRCGEFVFDPSMGRWLRMEWRALLSPSSSRECPENFQTWVLPGEANNQKTALDLCIFLGFRCNCLGLSACLGYQIHREHAATRWWRDAEGSRGQ